MSSTENVLDLNIAMGAPKQWMWLTKYFDDRLTVQNASSDGLAKINWKLTWKFSKCLKSCFIKVTEL